MFYFVFKWLNNILLDNDNNILCTYLWYRLKSSDRRKKRAFVSYKATWPFTKSVCCINISVFLMKKGSNLFDKISSDSACPILLHFNIN